MSDYAIEVKNLTKKFKDFTAVDEVSFKVPKGELFGLLGPNGAGKTTIMKVLSTLLKPTSGEADVMGYDVKTKRNEVRNSIGIVFQEVALDTKLTGYENLDFHSVMYGLSKVKRREKIKEVLKLVELYDSKDKLIEKYSGGMKRRLEIARGLIHEPDVLFLDEPTLGLDAQTRRHIWDYIRKLNDNKGISIILTTHYMEEADYLCDRVGIIDKGKVVSIDTPQELKNTIGADMIKLSVDGRCDSKIFERLKYVKEVKRHNCDINLSVEEGETKIPEILKVALQNNVVIKSITLQKPSLEDVFLKYTGKTIREKEASQTDINRDRARRRQR